jgi:aldehyde dehydrogenase (NAD+)
MYEQYHPMGVVGIISAFNFPVAVWVEHGLAWICGDVCVGNHLKTPPVVSSMSNIRSNQRK